MRTSKYLRTKKRCQSLGYFTIYFSKAFRPDVGLDFTSCKLFTLDSQFNNESLMKIVPSSRHDNGSFELHIMIGFPNLSRNNWVSSCGYLFPHRLLDAGAWYLISELWYLFFHIVCWMLARDIWYQWFKVSYFRCLF